MTADAGKNKEGPKKFKGTGGHTSRGVHIPANSKRAATSKENNRTGNLNVRTRGMSQSQGNPC